MDAESILELQKIDCNCSDCKFMARDVDKFKRSLEFHKELQLHEFEMEKIRWNAIVDEFYRRGEPDKGFGAEQELNKMKFQFDKSQCLVGWGACQKFNKEVSFISGVCQPHTQECFEHRKS